MRPFFASLSRCALLAAPALVAFSLCSPVQAQVIEKDVIKEDGIRYVHVIPEGVCPKGLDIELQGEVVKKALFNGGCPGFTKAINALVRDMHMDEVINRLEGITCGKKKSSCPDQLAKSLKILKTKTPDNR